MNIHLTPSKIQSSSKITITGSKSETNRLLLLQALFPELELKNTSNSDDSDVMLKALRDFSGTESNSQIINHKSQIINNYDTETIHISLASLG